MSRRLLLSLFALLLLALPLACEDDEQEPPSGAAETETTTTAAEAVDPPAELPRGWSEEINAEAGFSIGVPPGWTIESTEGGQGSRISSPDQRIVVTVTADRTRGALELPLDEFATRTAEAFGGEVVGRQGFRDLEVTRPAPFKDAYDAVAVRAIGRSKQSGDREQLFVVAVRREEMAAYVFVSRENAERRSSLASRDDVKEIIRSLRGRPPV